MGRSNSYKIFEELPCRENARELCQEVYSHINCEKFRRNHLAARASEAKENYKAGQCKSGSLQDLIKDLEDD